MNQKMAIQLMGLLKKGKKYREGRSNLFVELYYEPPFFIRHEYQSNGNRKEAHSAHTKMTEREMMSFILRTKTHR
jgi:hypothetical protein